MARRKPARPETTSTAAETAPLTATEDAQPRPESTSTDFPFGALAGRDGRQPADHMPPAASDGPRAGGADKPGGQTGHETITSDGPTRLPEAKRGAEAGKLPRKAGLVLVRHGNQYELTLQAETLTVGGLKFPAPEESDARAKLDERVAALRHFAETLDGLYGAFLDARLSGSWADTLGRMQRWLSRGERMAA